MEKFAIAAFVLNLGYCVLALGLLILALRLFDQLLGHRFVDLWREIKDENSVAMALYLGLRFVGACILLGSILS